VGNPVLVAGNKLKVDSAVKVVVRARWVTEVVMVEVEVEDGEEDGSITIKSHETEELVMK
jgi:hypothetical protein